MIDDLRELNEQFYALYGRLYKNRELLGKAQEDSMAAKLLAQYEAEYELLHLREEIARAKELYELRHPGFPRRKGKGKNAVGSPRKGPLKPSYAVSPI